ncbi:MAG: GHKL domain-containing protein [Eubacterium sp.]|nr:GHKL domain-containing protein [Eubacterium sp.]
MLFTIIFIIASVFQVYEFWLLYRCFFQESQWGRGAELAAFFLFFCITTSLYLFINIPLLTALGTYGTLLAIALIVYRSGWKRGLLLSVFAFISMTLAECIVALASGYIELNAFQSKEYYSIWGIVCLPIVQYMVVLLIRNFRNLRQGKDIPVLYWAITVMLPLFSWYLSLMLYRQDMYWLNMIGCTLVLFMMNILVFYLYDSQIENLRIRYEKENLEQLNMYQTEQLRLMNEMDEELREQRHDFQKHISMLSYMNNQGERDRMSEYLDEIRESDLYQKKYDKTGNFVIDSILGYKLQEAARYAIEVNTEVQVPKELELSVYDMTTLLTNLFDNAIEACRNVDDRRIKIRIKYAKRGLLIKISNTFDQKIIRDEKGEIVTRKADREQHGYGLKSIKRIVQKYQGDFEVYEKDAMFVADATLYLG